MTDKTSQQPQNGLKIDDWRVRRWDSKNWVIERFIPAHPHPTTGKDIPDRWDIYGYYGKLRDVAIALFDLSLPPYDLIATKDIITAIQEAEKRITDALIKVL